MSVAASGTDSTPDVTIDLTGTNAVAGDTITVTSDAGTTDTYTLTAADITNGNAVVTLSNQGSAGTKSITATLTDAAGNVGTASAAQTYAFTPDTTAPSAPTNLRDRPR